MDRFDELCKIRALARTENPKTSKDAAEKMVKSRALSKQEEEVLKVIKKYFSVIVFTTKDIAVGLTDYPYYKAYDICRKRFSGLRNKGKIELTGGRLDGCQVYKLL